VADAVEGAVRDAERLYGGLHVLFNNAGKVIWTAP
jgi:NAD(P)-dependent dehydrogenase (short-subunit alcohol dehydrogenase family)